MVLVSSNGMKDILVPIDKAGRVVLPKNVREELSILPGDILKISIQGNEVILRLKRDSSGFVRKGRALVFSNRGGEQLSRETVDAVLAGNRDERITGVANAIAPRKRKQ